MGLLNYRAIESLGKADMVLQNAKRISSSVKVSKPE
jgi:hypothetical protein